MENCANCPEKAFYVYSLTSDFKLFYCSLHLPKFLKGQKNTGAVTRYEEPAPTPAAPKSKKSAPKETAVEEPTIEEAPTEE